LNNDTREERTVLPLLLLLLLQQQLHGDQSPGKKTEKLGNSKMVREKLVEKKSVETAKELMKH